jgi:succinate dehydrogenase/fumarate reductase flavoprotein subunit
MGVWFNILAACPSGIWVDPDTGKRFVNELADRKTRADAILKTGHPCISIADQQAVQEVGKLDEMLEKGLVKKFNTLGELASAYKIPLTPLQETVREYNSYVEAGKDKEFGKPLRKGSGPVALAPFYAMRSWPKVHHCMGGVQINTKAQVIGLNHKPIKGLYAAGEAAGGVHGACRLGSCATTDCIVFGRIAGKNAAAS